MISPLARQTERKMNKIPLAVAVVLFGSLLAQPQTKDERSVYALGSDDQITIRVLNMPDISDKPVRIDADGYIKLPVVGSIKVLGLTVSKLEAELVDRLRSEERRV